MDYEIAPPSPSASPAPALPADATGGALVSIGSAIAFIIIPKMAFTDCGKVEALWTRGSAQEQSALYVLGCRARNLNPVAEQARRFQFRHGELDQRREFFLLEYPAPEPPPLALDGAPNPEAEDLAIAPFFSAVVRHRGTGAVQYFVLGQSINADLGGTNFRCITPEGSNRNLGIGPAPEEDAFLDKVREQCARDAGESPLDAAAVALSVSRVQRSQHGYGRETTAPQSALAADIAFGLGTGLATAAACYALHYFVFAPMAGHTSGIAHIGVFAAEALAVVLALFSCGYAAFKIRGAISS